MTPRPWPISNRDGVLGLYTFKERGTGRGLWEVHVLDGASRFQRFALQVGTPLTAHDAAVYHALPSVGDYNRDGIPDIYTFKTVVEQNVWNLKVRILDGRTNYQTYLAKTVTPIRGSRHRELRRHLSRRGSEPGRRPRRVLLQGAQDWNR